MEFKITGKQVALLLSVFSAGTGAGVLGHYIYTVKHTPEDKIRELRDLKSAIDFAKKESAQEAYNASAELNRLRATKREYQDEIRPQIEAKVRKELQTYISQAEVSYNKAKELQKEAQKDREIAELKLDLAKTLNKSVTHTEKETKIIVKEKDDDDDLKETENK